MTHPIPDAGKLLELVEAAADAFACFVSARDAMNAARPDPCFATPAERALYDERYRADHEAEREHWRTAVELAHHSAPVATALRAQASPEPAIEGEEV